MTLELKYVHIPACLGLGTWLEGDLEIRLLGSDTLFGVMSGKQEGSRKGAFLSKLNDARGCIAANRDRLPDHLVQPGIKLALAPLHSLTFSQFGGKIVFGPSILCPNQRIFKLKIAPQTKLGNTSRNAEFLK